MPLNTQISETAVNVQADAIGALCDGGFVDIYSGPQPSNADTAISTQELLVSMGFDATAFGHAQGGIISSNAITAGTAISDGEPRWFRAYRADHRTVVFDGSAGKDWDNNMHGRARGAGA